MSSNLIGPIESIPIVTSMKKSTIIVVLCAAIAVLSLSIDPYIFAGIMIAAGILYMVFHIMEETRDLPDVLVKLGEDARALLLRNRGNAPAFNIHVTLVPLNIEFEIPQLEVEATAAYPLPSMLNEAKAIVTFQNGAGKKLERIYPLSALGKDEDDLLKPAFPLFGWK